MTASELRALNSLRRDWILQGQKMKVSSPSSYLSPYGAGRAVLAVAIERPKGGVYEVKPGDSISVIA
jgi:LysM repeat protein